MIAEYICPIFESADYLCDREAVHLVAGTAICWVHAKRLRITLDKLAANLKEPADA